ncbi:hypothetical protein EDD22DRAFT_852993 [Suillus occidentalis]|nr:hypothetical protein EDD22DRAFT_852993 [Suillus occidentalis]
MNEQVDSEDLFHGFLCNMILVKIHFVLSDQPTFSTGGSSGHWPYRTFYHTLLEVVSVMNPHEQEDLLNWWNDKIYADFMDLEENDGELSIVAWMKAQATSTVVSATVTSTAPQPRPTAAVIDRSGGEDLGSVDCKHVVTGIATILPDTGVPRWTSSAMASLASAAHLVVTPRVHASTHPSTVNTKVPRRLLSSAPSVPQRRCPQIPPIEVTNGEGPSLNVHPAKKAKEAAPSIMEEKKEVVEEKDEDTNEMRFLMRAELECMEVRFIQMEGMTKEMVISMKLVQGSMPESMPMSKSH